MKTEEVIREEFDLYWGLAPKNTPKYRAGLKALVWFLYLRHKELEELREKIEGKKVVNEGKPDTELTYPHYEFGYRVGYNQALTDILKELTDNTK